MSITRLVWHEGQRYTGIDSWGNAVVPINGEREEGTGAKPSDLLPISLAACAAYTMVQILTKQRQTWGSLEARVESLQADEAPWGFRRIAITYRFSGPIDRDKAQKALDLAHSKYCAVAASLDPAIETIFTVE
ncbi:MAG: OsmC family protein [Actinomycetota bacterium]